MSAFDVRACEECGGRIIGGTPGRPAKYCSPRCCNRSNLRKARARKAAAQPAPEPVPAPESPAAGALKPHEKGVALATQRTAEGARRRIDPTTSEREYSDEEREFLRAVDRYRRECKRPWPTATELLQIAVSLGYRKVAPAGPLPGAK